MGEAGPRTALAPALESLRLRNVAANPQHKEPRQDADPEQRAPGDRGGQDGKKARIDECCETRAKGGAGLHKAHSAAAILVADDFPHQHRAGRPFAAETEPVQAAQDEQLGEILRKPAQKRKNRVPQDRYLEHTHPPEAIGERPGKPAAERRGDHSDGADCPGGAG